MLDHRKQPRTHYIHRISYTTQERITGLFVLIAVGILMWLMLASGKTSHLFEEQLTLYGRLDNARSVNKGTEVQVSGLSVGQVAAIEATSDNRIVLTLKILKKYHGLLRTDSVATLAAPDLAVLGNTAIEISAGSPDAPLLPDGSTIVIQQTPGLAQLTDSIGPLLDSLQASAQQLNAILQQVDPAQLNDTLNNFNAASRNMNDITTAVKNGNGIVSQSLYDPAFRQNIQTTVNNMQQASAKINQLLDSLNRQMALVPGLLEKAGPLLQEADKTLKASQRIWPLSTAVGEEPDKPTLTSPVPTDD